MDSPDDRERWPRYRLITGTDDDVFCHRVSAGLAMGYTLYGQPVLASSGDGGTVVGQALLWPDPDTEPPPRDSATS